MFVYGGESKTNDVDISIIQYLMTFTLPHQQMFIDILNFANFFLSVQRNLSRLLSLVSVSCLRSPVSCLLSPVSRLLSSVSCPLSTVSCLPCCKCCRFNLWWYSGFSNFMEQICRLGQFSNLNALSGLSRLKANLFQWIWSLADIDFSVSLFSWAKLELAISDKCFSPAKFSVRGAQLW